MPKFYVHRTAPAEVTEVVEIEAADHDAAYCAVLEGEGETIGLAVGDYIDWAGDERVETFSAQPHNLPVGFVPSKP